MAALAVPVINPNHQDNHNFRSWPIDATEALIRRRRHYHERFCATCLQKQKVIWERISNHIYNNYDLNVTPTQCWVKWNVLVAGYENLKKLLNDNPEGYRTYTPSFYDRQFYHDLSDKFWYNMGGNYYLIN
jgi:hypothetical protein